MYRIRKIIIFYTGLLLCMACTPKFQKETYLQIAMQEVDEHPEEALTFLEEIPYPRYMDHDNYMRYIVTLTQARYMNDLDITGDTLILEAQRYFAGKDNPEMAARSSYYAAAYWDEKEMEEKALEYSFLANYYSGQARNNLFQAKSMHWIGSIYYDRDILDSARVYYHQAEELYNTIATTEIQQLSIKYMLGRTYRELEQYDLAFNYFNEGLDVSRNLGNQLYEGRFMYCKGIIFREKKEFQLAKEHFNLALLKKIDAEDSLRIYLNYAKLYKMNNQSDSTKYYLDLVKNRVEELSFPYNRKSAYKELALYYQSEGNSPEVEHYLRLMTKSYIDIFSAYGVHPKYKQSTSYAKRRLYKKQTKI